MELLFWLMAALVAWCYAGYPAWMLWRARGREASEGGPGDFAAFEPPVTVVLAARNQAHTIEARIQNLLEQEYGSLEVIVACNGCVDGTEDRVAAIARDDSRVRVVTSPANEGKAGAINAGVNLAAHPLVVFADSRQLFHPAAIRRLVSGFSTPDVGVVSGRTTLASTDSAALHGVGMYWGFETRLRHAESLTGTTVQAQGAIYAIRRELFRPIPANTILDDVFLPGAIALQGFRIKLVPGALAWDQPASGQREEYRRKVRTMTGNIQLLRLLPTILSPWHNPMWFRFISHKLLRVATPLLLIGMLATSLFLASFPYHWIAAAQLGFYVAGAVGLIVKHRALSVPAAFILVHAALLHALLRPGRDASTVWTTPRPVRAVTQ